MDKTLKIYNHDYDWSKQQENAIITDGEVIVSASAGSGKTLTLIHRIIAEIGRGTSLKRMIVLAYNNAAGEELRDRLSTELYNQLMKGGETEELFRQAIEDLPFANIGTTHSFCSAMIRQNFEALDISPSFEILSDDAAQILINTALDNVFDKYIEEQDEIFLEFGDIFSFSRGDDELRDIVTRLYSIIDIRPDRKSFFDTVNECYSEDVWNSPFAKIVKDIYVENLNRIKDDISICQNRIHFLGKQEEYQDILDVYGDILIYINTVEHSDLKNIIDISKTLDKLSTKANRNHDDNRERFKLVVTEFRDLVNKKFLPAMEDSDYFEVGHEQGKVYIAKLLEIVSRFEAEYTLLKEQKNMLTYNDLEHKMIELLDIKGEEIRKDFDAIFVDEYQDVNPTQEYIYSHLINDVAFFVGDVKQSIYEFRLADPKIFLARQAKYPKERAIQFSENHRSVGEILTFVNDIFSSVMTKETADVDYTNDKHAFITKVKDFGKKVQIHFFVEPKEVNPTEKLSVYSIVNHQQKEKFASADECEGEYIAETIDSLLGQKKDGGEGVYRYEDFAILFRKRSAATKILSVLRNHNIPLDIGSFNDSESKPETELIAMLSVIDNPRQDVALVSYMQSILGGYDKNELLEIEKYRDNIYTTNYYDALLAIKDTGTELGKKVKNTVDIIEEFRLRASFKTVSELLRDIISEFAYDAYLMQRGDSDVAEIEAYITAIEGIEENNSLAKFMSVYGKRKNSEDKGGTFGGNRVKISTYHGFKGLEVPIVFLPTLNKKNSDTRTPTVSYYGNGYLAMDYYEKENKRTYKTLSRYAIDLLNKQAEEKSEMRLLYVALTRAKERMYLLSNVGANYDLDSFGKNPSFDWKTSMIDYIEEAVYNGSLEFEEGKNLYREEKYLEKNAKEENKYIIERDDFQIEEIITQAEKYVYPYEESTKLSASYSVSALNTALDSEEELPSLYQYATKAGTLYHKVMEKINFNARTIEEINKELDWMEMQGIIESVNRDMIDVQDLYRVMNSQIIKEASNGRCMREYKFTMYTPANTVIEEAKTDDKVLVQGVIDMVYEVDGKINLIDYKLSRKTGEVLKNSYKKQLYLYKKAFESAFKKKIDNMGILSLITGEFTKID